MYRDKYLKYKQKYFNLRKLKKQQSGGDSLIITNNDGTTKSFDVDKNMLVQIANMKINDIIIFGKNKITKINDKEIEITMDGQRNNKHFKFDSKSRDELLRNTPLVNYNLPLKIYHNKQEGNSFIKAFISESDKTVMDSTKQDSLINITVKKDNIIENIRIGKTTKVKENVGQGYNITPSDISEIFPVKDTTEVNFYYFYIK